MNKQRTGFLRLRTALVLVVVLVCLSASVLGKDVLLLVHSGDAVFTPTIKGLTDELEEDFDIHHFKKRKATVAKLTRRIARISPKILVLMDNWAIGLFQGYQDGLPPGAFIIPSISIMSINVGEAISGLKNAVGISYNVPVVTSLVHFRSISSTPIKNTGIICREVLKNFVAKNNEYCRAEGIALHGVLLSNHEKDIKNSITRGLEHLLKTEKVDSFWIPNDPILLRKTILADVWVPFFKKHKIPIVVGVKHFVAPDSDFGTFAVLPDLVELGGQAAELILEAKDNKWALTGDKTKPAISTRKILNAKQAGTRYKLKKDSLQRIDEVLK
ncbi:MAG: hypothetical protein GY765_39240 [bacterium]|nr:hypothetical protein [bacterium]